MIFQQNGSLKAGLSYSPLRMSSTIRLLIGLVLVDLAPCVVPQAQRGTGDVIGWLTGSSAVFW
jgi:hypothetical protein